MEHHKELQFLSSDQVHFFRENGFLVLEKLISETVCEGLKLRAGQILRDQKDEFDQAIFTTHDQEKTANAWFLGSGDKVRLFMEEEDDGGPGHRVNKIGHALHDLDPEFNAFSRQAPLGAIAHDIGFLNPLLVQSMYIFKQARIGGEVKVHQDSTFLYTEPQTCIGFWFAIQDANLENGCLWALPGGHKEALREKFHRKVDGACAFETLDSAPLPKTGYLPLEVPQGTLVLLHGNLPHYSEANRSDKPREAYAVHLIEQNANYPIDNWLQRENGLDFKGF